MTLLVKILLVATGGATGSLIRYFLECQFKGSGAITWVINTVGSFLMGLFFGLLLATDVTSTKRALVHTLLMTGFCGGFSTFSHFSIYTVNCMNNGNIGMATVYILATVIAGVGCCAFGVWLGTRLIGG